MEYTTFADGLALVLKRVNLEALRVQYTAGLGSLHVHDDHHSKRCGPPRSATSETRSTGHRLVLSLTTPCAVSGGVSLVGNLDLGVQSYGEIRWCV